MKEHWSDRPLSILLSVLVHAAIIGALVWGWFSFHNRRPTPSALAIQATLVSARGVHAVKPPTAAPVAPPVAPAPPKPTAQQLEQQKQKLAQQRAAQAKALAAAQAKAKAVARARAVAKARANAEAKAQAKARQLAEQQARERAAKLAAEKAAAEEAAAERKAKELARRKAKAEAERKAALARKRAKEAQARRVADLQSELKQEEQIDAERASPAMAQYVAMITARITQAWIRPPSAQHGLTCIVNLTQVPGGDITSVSIGKCNGDEAVRESVEAAAYRASPLPPPPNPALFESQIAVTFAPDQ